MLPFDVGTIAMFEVTATSRALRVATVGWNCDCGHNVRNPSGPGGTTVALNTKASAVSGRPHVPPATGTSFLPLNGSVPDGTRVSSTRHGGAGYNDRPPVVM